MSPRLKKKSTEADPNLAPAQVLRNLRTQAALGHPEAAQALRTAEQAHVARATAKALRVMGHPAEVVPATGMDAVRIDTRAERRTRETALARGMTAQRMHVRERWAEHEEIIRTPPPPPPKTAGATNARKRP